jgi:hypothetical protein
MRFFYQGMFEEGFRKSVGGKITIQLLKYDEKSIAYHIKAEVQEN